MSVLGTKRLLLLSFLGALEGDVTAIFIRLRGRVTLILSAKVNHIFRGLVSFPLVRVWVRSVLDRPFPSLLRLVENGTLLGSIQDLRVVVAEVTAAQQRIILQSQLRLLDAKVLTVVP